MELARLGYGRVSKPLGTTDEEGDGIQLATESKPPSDANDEGDDGIILVESAATRRPLWKVVAAAAVTLLFVAAVAVIVLTFTANRVAPVVSSVSTCAPSAAPPSLTATVAFRSDDARCNASVNASVRANVSQHHDFPYVATVTIWLDGAASARANVTYRADGHDALRAGGRELALSAGANVVVLVRLGAPRCYNATIELRAAAGHTDDEADEADGGGGACADGRVASLTLRFVTRAEPSLSGAPSMRVVSGTPTFGVLFVPSDHQPWMFDRRGNLIWHKDVGYGGTSGPEGQGMTVDQDERLGAFVIASVNREFAPLVLAAVDGRTLARYDVAVDCARRVVTHLTHEARVDRGEPPGVMLAIRTYLANYSALDTGWSDATTIEQVVPSFIVMVFLGRRYCRTRGRAGRAVRRDDGVMSRAAHAARALPRERCRMLLTRCHPHAAARCSRAAAHTHTAARCSRASTRARRRTLFALEQVVPKVFRWRWHDDAAGSGGGGAPMEQLLSFGRYFACLRRPIII
jgi:hypothetical protein